MKNITLEGWKIFSDRLNSRNYINEDGTKMLKVFTSFTKMDEKGLVKEKEVSDKVYKLGISTPLTYDIVHVGDELGIIYQYISCKKSISRAMSEDYANKDKYLKIFTDFSREIHSKHCDPKEFVSVKQLILEGLEDAYYFDENEKKNIKTFLNTIKDTDTCLVRDFQFSNVIMDKNMKPFLIDLGTVCYGNPDFDLAFLYYFTHYIEEYAVTGVLHLTYPQANECWDKFIRFYYPDYSEEQIKLKDEYLSKLCVVMMLSQIHTLNVVDLLAEVKHRLFEDTFK